MSAQRRIAENPLQPVGSKFRMRHGLVGRRTQRGDEEQPGSRLWNEPARIQSNHVHGVAQTIEFTNSGRQIFTTVTVRQRSHVLKGDYARSTLPLSSSTRVNR